MEVTLECLLQGFSAYSWGLDSSVAEALSTVEFSRTPGLYPVDARSIPPSQVVTIKNVSKK